MPVGTKSKIKNGKKECTTCLKWLPATTEYFHTSNRLKSGLNPRCKKCRNLIAKKHYDENKQKRVCNTRTILLKRCTVCNKLYPFNKKYFRTNNHVKCGLESRCKKCGVKYDKKYRIKNKEKISIQHRKHYLNNLEKYKINGKNHYQNNKEKYRTWSKNRRILKRSSGKGITAGEWVCKIEKYNGLCCYCGVKLVIPFVHRNPDSITQDHYIPLKPKDMSMAGKHEINNAFPACTQCNDKKGNKLNYTKPRIFKVKYGIR